MSMNIYAGKGTKVRVLFDEKGIMNGTDSDKEHAEEYLTRDTIYTIDHTLVGSWHTSVFLEEHPVVSFNSVHFEEIKEPVFTLEDMRKSWEDGEFNGVYNFQQNLGSKDAATFKDFMKEQYKISLP